jgi:hypothetical protein
MSNYGLCPQCGKEGHSRERRLNGNDGCVNGHTYPSSTAVYTSVTSIEDEISAIYDDCSVKDWDGYDACAISSKTVENAKLFVNNFPEFFKNRTVAVVPENDGNIAIEINNKDDSTMLSFSFTNNPLYVRLFVLPTNRAGK